MSVPFHRSINAKGALALSFSAFVIPVLFVLFVDAFLLPQSAHKSQMMAYEDLPAVQAVFEISSPHHLAARDLTPKLGYMLGNPHLLARQRVDDPEADNADEEEEQQRQEEEEENDRTTTSRRPTGTSRPRHQDEDRNRDEDEDEDKDKPKPKDEKKEAAKATEKPKPKPKPKVVYSCAWSRMIQNTNTTPLWLTLGLSAGAIAGIIIAAFTAYQYGKASKPGGGAAGGMGGGAPPMF